MYDENTTYVLSRDFWDVGDPRVESLRRGTTTLKDFLDTSPEDDPVFLRDWEGMVVVTAYHEKRLAEVRAEFIRRERIKIAMTGGITLTWIKEHLDFLEEKLPGLTFLLDLPKDREPLNKYGRVQRFVRHVKKHREIARTALAPLFTTLGTHGVVLLCGGEIDPDTIEVPETPFDGKRELPESTHRHSFFDNPLVCQARCRESCRQCREDESYRKLVLTWFQIPTTVAIPTDDGREQPVSTVHPTKKMPYDYACPYAGKVASRYPKDWEEWNDQ